MMVFSPWNAALESRMAELKSLPYYIPEYYGGSCVKDTCANFANHLLNVLFVEGVPAPQLVPGGDGTVQMEWHRNGFDLEIDIALPYGVFATRRDLVNNLVDEIEVTSDLSILLQWISNLAPAVKSEQGTHA